MQAITLDTALEQIAIYLEVDAQQLKVYAEEDQIGGFAFNDIPMKNQRWPIGSIWEPEGKVLYVLIRYFKPKIIVEVGTYYGCSTAHLVTACARNDKGLVYCVDIDFEKMELDPLFAKYVQRIETDALQWIPDFDIDFLFEDGEHCLGFTETIMRNCLPQVRTDGLVLCHDYFHNTVSVYVRSEFDRATKNQAQGVLIEPSDCGLGYFQKR